MLETWLPQVFARLEELARLCHARRGSIGAFIEDKNSGTILLQQALRRQMPAHAIDSKLTAMGKDEDAVSVSGYVHRELVKYTDRAFEKTVIYKRHSRNHLLDQVESFRIGDRGSDREDDLLDTEFAKAWIAQGLVQGEECAWFAAQHMTWSEVYLDLTQILRPIVDACSGAPPVIRLSEWRPYRLLVIRRRGRFPQRAVAIPAVVGARERLTGWNYSKRLCAQIVSRRSRSGTGF